MKKLFIMFITASAAVAAGIYASPIAISQAFSNTTVTQPTAANNLFVKKRYSIQGEWSVIRKDGQTQIKFSDSFKTKGGPDLKVYLSTTRIEDLDSQSASENTVSIGVLKAKSGGQIYTVPNDIDLEQYQSVIIHCEAFSVLWGGFNLPSSKDSSP